SRRAARSGRVVTPDHRVAKLRRLHERAATPGEKAAAAAALKRLGYPVEDEAPPFHRMSDAEARQFARDYAEAMRRFTEELGASVAELARAFTDFGKAAAAAVEAINAAIAEAQQPEDQPALPSE